jgi:hypothetical protein
LPRNVSHYQKQSQRKGRIMGRTKAQEYRFLAQQCRDMAQTVTSVEGREPLLNMAETWEQLAQVQEKATDLKGSGGDQEEG